MKLSDVILTWLGVIFLVFLALFILMHLSTSPVSVDGPEYREPSPSAEQDYERYLREHWGSISEPLKHGWRSDHEWRKGMLAEMYPRFKDPEYARSAGFLYQLMEERRRQAEAFERNRKIRLSPELTEARSREAYFEFRAEERWSNTVEEFKRVIFY